LTSKLLEDDVGDVVFSGAVRRFHGSTLAFGLGFLKPFLIYSESL
jgi:hypothetical protein